jgi:molecular chaperone Hsp33
MTSDNLIETFIIERSGLRGRIVRMGAVLDDILKPHGYVPAVSHVTAEAALLATMLASMLKYQGIFTLQAQGDGPVAVVVADLNSAGELRACATVREAHKDKVPESAGPMETGALFGKGYLAFTVDQGAQTERYQGIVELKPGRLEESVRNYFRQSEQIMTGLKMAVSFKDGHWRGGGILIQHIPEEGGQQRTVSSIEEDAWRHTMILLESCTDAELTDPGLDANELLFRLFHEDGVRVFEPLALRKGCRCTRDRLSGILSSMPQSDIDDMAEGGVVTMTCQFCSCDFTFAPEDIAKAQASSRDEG